MVDSLTELYPRSTSRVNYLKNAIEGTIASNSESIAEFKKNFSISISGSMELSPEFEDDGVTLKGYTDLTAEVFYSRAGGNMLVTDIPESAYTWSEVGADEPLQEGGKTIRISKVGQFQCTVAYSYPIGGLEPSSNADVDISLTTIFTTRLGTIKLYTCSDAETREELLQSLDNLRWYTDPDSIQRDTLYLWRKESTDGGTTWKYFRDTGLKGDSGKSFNVVIESTNGNVFRPTSISTTLTCRVYLNMEEITDTLEDYRFNWKRNTGNTDSDTSWNNSSKAIGKKSIDVTTEDCIGRTVFDCIVDIGE